MSRSVQCATRVAEQASLDKQAALDEKERLDEQAALHFRHQWATADGRYPKFEALRLRVRRLEQQYRAIAAQLAILGPELRVSQAEAAEFSVRLVKVPHAERVARVARAREALAYVLREGFVRPADHEGSSRLHLVSTDLDRAMCCRANLLIVDLSPYAEPTCAVDIRRPDEIRRAILRRPYLQRAPGGGVRFDHLDAFAEAVAIRDLYNNTLVCPEVVAVSYESVRAVVRAALPCIVLPPDTRITPAGIQAGARLYPKPLGEVPGNHPNKASLVRWLARFVRSPAGEPAMTTTIVRSYLDKTFALCMERRRALQEYAPRLEQEFWSWPRTLDEPWEWVDVDLEVLVEGARSKRALDEPWEWFDAELDDGARSKRPLDAPWGADDRPPKRRCSAIL
jgi:hypothetical protein